MAYRLFDALNRAAKAFGGAPDPRGISPQMQSNLDKQAAQVRFQGFRRMQGRPGITGPFGFVAGRSAPISPPAAASWVSGKLGTPYAPELNRMTAPDPMTFATNARAPEFVGQQLDLGATGIEAAQLANRGTGIDLDFQRPQLQQQLDIGQQGLTQAETEEAQRALLRPSEVTLAEQDVTRGEFDIGALEREAAGAPSRGELRGTRDITQRLLETQAEQAGNEQQLAAMQSDIDALEAQGDYDGANQVRQRRDALLGNRMGPPAPATGGAPSMSTGNINPARVEMDQRRAAAIATNTQIGGVLAVLAEVANDTGWPDKRSEKNLERAITNIRNMLDSAPNESVRAMLKEDIRKSDEYQAIKVRESRNETFGRSVRGTLSHPISAIPALVTGAPYRQLDRIREDVASLVDLIEG